jgi:hypothetical protein
VKSAYIAYIIMGAKLTLLIKISPVDLTYLYAICYIYINLSRVSLMVTFFMPVVNTIEDLLLLVKSTRVDPLDIEILVVNIIEDLLLLAVSTRADPLVLLP